MKMEDLNKTQIVLLTLLVSFVTSIATGIVTVTLMDQAPPGVTQTINRVVEKTIQTVIPGENQVTTVVKEVIVEEKDLIANAVEKSSKSVVQISAISSEGVEVSLGLGVIVSGDGFIVTDKKRIAGNRNNLLATYKGLSFAAEVVSDKANDFAILKINISDNFTDEKIVADEKNTSSEKQKTQIILEPAMLADSNNVKLGQMLVSLGGEFGGTVFTGIVSRLEKETIVLENKKTKTEKETSPKDETVSAKETEVLKYIITNAAINKKSAGGPVFGTDGSIVGINLAPMDGSSIVVPINNIKKALLEIMNSVKEKTVDVGNKTDLTKTN
jgi:S1-C subfamily serine protease